MSHFDRALEIAPDTVACRLEKARLVGKHDLEAAKQVLREAGDLNPSLLFELGLILKKQQRSEESLQAFREACAAFPDYKEMPHAWMRYLADALRDDASYEESEKWYKRLLEVHECFRCWMAYATLLEKLGSDRRDDALKAIEKAEAHDENSEDERERAKALRATMNAENGAEVSAGG